MTQRRHLLQAATGIGASLLLPGLASAQAGGARRFQGVTLNVSTFSAAYPKLLQQWLPEFEAQTGAKVNFDAPSFPVYNQRADLELSTKGSAYDVVNVTFIYSSRWINSGWLTPLDEFIANPQLTAADWDVNDFLGGARAPETGRDGKLYGIPWTAEALLSVSSRFDLVQQAGLEFPDTTDDLVKVLRAVNKKERVAGFVSDSHYGWTFVPYLHAFGGDVFRKAPDDLFPTLDTPEAIAAADYYAQLIREFGPDGAVTYQPDQVTQALKLGRVNFSDAGQLHLAQLGDAATSKTLKTVKFGFVPKGPAGRFPGTAVHGLGIPAGSRNKEAAWAFIQWALSKQTTRRAVAAGYGSPSRRSDIDSAEFRSRQRINGSDLAQLSLDTITQAERTGHMKYRTVSVYPQVDQQLNKAIALIATGQANARQAMQQAQAQSIAELRRAGQKI
ncbi:ABC transporter substrate-binding protein [Paracidovorax konjaci]|uniref:Multiple sugar transport system substrate-binding protein n=1 Tax=Paracidovorax konjaci TaxID=32040 RepID=A0A1I1VG40_9BURK|nr:extracellular solute-binding protein [Paracidovorax konjaci]SFD81916.1 multiple sugar transport system substrate-binding protein [Paracidovorax konjaci]